MRRVLAALLLACGCAKAPPPTRMARAESVNEPCARRHQDDVARGIGVRQSSAIALARSGRRTIAYVADGEERAIHVVDVDARRWLSVTPLDRAPEQLLVLDDGRIAVSFRWDNRVALFEPAASPEEPL